MGDVDLVPPEFGFLQRAVENFAGAPRRVVLADLLDRRAASAAFAEQVWMALPRLVIKLKALSDHRCP
jgi:hypothetical protein